MLATLARLTNGLFVYGVGMADSKIDKLSKDKTELQAQVKVLEQQVKSLKMENEVLKDKVKDNAVVEEEGEDRDLNSSNNPSLPVQRISDNHNSVKSSHTVNNNNQCMVSSNSSVNMDTSNQQSNQLLSLLRLQ